MTNSTIFFIFQHQPFQLSLLWQKVQFDLAAPKGWRKGCKNNQKKNRIVAKSRPTAINLTSSVATSSSSVKDPIASRSPQILEASSRLVVLCWRLDASTNKNSNPDEVSSSQGWPRDAQLFINTGRLVATDKDQNF